MTTTFNLTLPTRPQDLTTDTTPYIDNAIGMLSNSTAFLYDDNAPWAVKVTEVKSEVLDAVDKVDVKVDEVKAEVAEIKTEMRSLGERQDRLESQIDNVRTGVNNGMAI